MAGKKSILYLRYAAAFVFLVLFALSFSGFCRSCAYLMHVEFVPAVLHLAAGVSAGAAAVILCHFLLACCAGRVYCSVLCPLGILQDIAGFIPFAKNTARRDIIPLRFAVFGIAAGTLVSGSAAGLYWLDPYSLAGRSVSAVLWGATLPAAVILLISLWKRRAFCTYICPVGTLLGLLSRKSIWHLEISDSCVNCKKCLKACPAGCADPENRTIDNERCLRCMQCTAVCPVGAIKFVRKREKTSVNRREFIKKSLWTAAGFAAGVIAVRTSLLKKLLRTPDEKLIYPPGAGDADTFQRKCTGCLLCVKACPQKIIVPDKYGAGPVRLDLAGGFCRFDCTRCGDICPTGAIRQLPLAVKQRLAIAKAKFDPTVCIVYQEGEPCGKCARICPAGAITLRRGAPRFNARLCTGCGACRTVCPTKAFSINAIEKQQPLNK